MKVALEILLWFSSSWLLAEFALRTPLMADDALRFTSMAAFVRYLRDVLLHLFREGNYIM